MLENEIVIKQLVFMWGTIIAIIVSILYLLTNISILVIRLMILLVIEFLVKLFSSFLDIIKGIKSVHELNHALWILLLLLEIALNEECERKEIKDIFIELFWYV